MAKYARQKNFDIEDRNQTFSSKYIPDTYNLFVTMPEVEGYWDIIVTSLQDVCNSNESITFDNIYSDHTKNGGVGGDMSNEELLELQKKVSDHKSNLETSTRLVETCQQNLLTLISHLQKPSPTMARQSRSNSSKNLENEHTNGIDKSYTVGKTTGKNNKHTGKSVPQNKKQKKSGRLFYTSKHNPLSPVVVGSEVAYKLKNRHTEEWIQCEVTRIIGDGIKFEVRDPEPDENNNPGQTFKANYKEIILITEEAFNHPNYTYGSKVLARYPETTTFYPAVVVGTKKDGTVKLKFDGEEEANKETEVERKLVLPFPEK